MKNQPLKLSPSDFTFLWEQCKRCFYLKVVGQIRRPSTPMPKIFTRIDLAMKGWFAGRRTEEVIPSLPPGVLEYSEKWVQSQPLSIPGANTPCFLRGKFDTVIHFDDGRFAVVDFKTSDRNESHIPLYARQLHSYAIALEQAAAGRLCLKPISHLGLLVFEPDAFVQEGGERCLLKGALTWLEINRDDQAFLKFLVDVLDVLDQPTPPEADAQCEWCHYRNGDHPESVSLMTVPADSGHVPSPSVVSRSHR
jgi:hypothetical protein